MKTQKTHINAVGCQTKAYINITLQLDQSLTPDEARRERKDLNNCIFEALRKYGFNYQDISAK